MTTAIVQVENLSKRYALRRVNHHYATLKDSLTQAGARFARRLAFRPPLQSKREDFWALQNVAFTLEHGQRVGIVGRNGAGKSTLLKLLSRITEPTTGRIRISGRVSSLLEVGTGFHPDLTGRENIFLNGAILGMSRVEIRRKFDEIVAFAEVDKFLETPVKRYSSGMYVRLAFAVAAHLDPEILIVDEVLSVGDAEFQKKCIGKMQDVSAGLGRTVLFVSHNMAAVQSLCTHGLYLQQGRVAYFGTAAEAVNLYTRHGAGSSLTNLSLSGHDFDLCSIRAYSEDQGALTTFRPATLEVHFVPHEAVLEAGVHVLLEDLNGSPVLGLDSKDFMARTAVRAGQRTSCVFSIESLPLTPGPYRLRVWLKSEADSMFWEVPQTFDISVQDSAIYGARRLERQWHGTTAVAAQARMEVHS